MEAQKVLVRLTEEEDLPATRMTAVAPGDEGLGWAAWEAAPAETDQPRRAPPRTRALRGSERPGCFALPSPGPCPDTQPKDDASAAAAPCPGWPLRSSQGTSVPSREMPQPSGAREF